MQDFFDTQWFTIGDVPLTFGQVIVAMAFTVLCITLYWYVARRLLPTYFTRMDESEQENRRVQRIILYIFAFSILSGLIVITGVDKTLMSSANFTLSISTILHAILIFQLARLVDWVISRVFIHGFYERRDQPRPDPRRKVHTEETASKTVQISVYIIAAILILRSFEIDYIIHSFALKDGAFDLKISNILIAILVIFIARLVIWMVTQLFLYSYYKRQNVNVGSQYAFNQLLKYVVYTLAVLSAIISLGVNPTLILGGLAALLVGVGLGLQQTFNDFFSGIILLFERSVELGDVLEVDGMVGSVKRIGIRASLVETRDNLTVVVPNSRLVTQNVINWSHFDDKVRFQVEVSVAYGTDTALVKEALLDVAKENPYIIEYPAAFVRLANFGDSGIAFQLHFWSRSFLIIEDVKSDLRLKVDAEFKKRKITIPFPQRDVWMRSKGG